MTIHNDLRSLKAIAKKIARENRIPHHEALDYVAKHIGQPHWNALTTAYAKGWRPQPAATETLDGLTNDPDLMAIPTLGVGQVVKRTGFINGHPYALEVDFEVVMGGAGWAILLEHAPSEKPVIEIYDQRGDNPLRDPNFEAEALDICFKAAVDLRKRIAADWPRRSTKPNAEGQAQHPLSKGLSSTWHCLHCDGVLSGSQMAANMWHCPECNANPLDIFMEPFWKANDKQAKK